MDDYRDGVRLGDETFEPKRRAFSVKLITSYAEYSKFVKMAKVELNHTYAVLWNESDKRGLLVFKVTISQLFDLSKVKPSDSIRLFGII